MRLYLSFFLFVALITTGGATPPKIVKIAVFATPEVQTLDPDGSEIKHRLEIASMILKPIINIQLDLALLGNYGDLGQSLRQLSTPEEKLNFFRAFEHGIPLSNFGKNGMPSADYVLLLFREPINVNEVSPTLEFTEPLARHIVANFLTDQDLPLVAAKNRTALVRWLSGLALAHEILHTLGAIHTQQPNQIMSPTLLFTTNTNQMLAPEIFTHAKIDPKTNKILATGDIPLDMLNRNLINLLKGTGVEDWCDSRNQSFTNLKIYARNAGLKEQFDLVFRGQYLLGMKYIPSPDFSAANLNKYLSCLETLTRTVDDKTVFTRMLENLLNATNLSEENLQAISRTRDAINAQGALSDFSGEVRLDADHSLRDLEMTVYDMKGKQVDYKYWSSLPPGSHIIKFHGNERGVHYVKFVEHIPQPTPLVYLKAVILR